MLDRCTFESQDVGGYTVDAQEVGEHQSAICNQKQSTKCQQSKFSPVFKLWESHVLSGQVHF